MHGGKLICQKSGNLGKGQPWVLKDFNVFIIEGLFLFSTPLSVIR